MNTGDLKAAYQKHQAYEEQLVLLRKYARASQFYVYFKGHNAMNMPDEHFRPLHEFLVSCQRTRVSAALDDLENIGVDIEHERRQLELMRGIDWSEEKS